MKDLVYSSGDVIFYEGDPGESMFDIVSGTIGVYSEYRTDNEVKLTELKPGQMFGEMAMLENAPRSTTIVAEADGTVLHEIDADEAKKLFTTDAEFVKRIMKHLSSRLRSLTDDYKDVMDTLKEIEDAKKLGIAKSDGLISKIKFYVKQAAHSKGKIGEDSLEKIWGNRNRRADRNASVRGRTPCERKRPIFREGEEGDCMYYVYVGSVNIFVNYGEINEKLITTVEEGGFFGEMGMIEHLPRSATAIAKTDNTYVEQIFEEDIAVLVEKTPDFVLQILSHLSNRLRQLTHEYYNACSKVSAAA